MPKNFTFGDKLLQDISLLRANEEFLADIKRIQNKYKLPTPPNEDFENSELFSDDEKLNFTQDIETLREKYNLLPIHDLFLQFFIQSGKIEFDPEEIVERVYLNPHFQIIDDNKKCVNLKIYPGTTIKDIQKNWPRIKSKLNEISKSDKRKNKSNNLERDLYIYELKKQGLTAKKVVEKIRENEKFKNEIIGYEEVPKIIERLKDKASKYAPPKES